jgi:hypothetical protein
MMGNFYDQESNVYDLDQERALRRRPRNDGLDIDFSDFDYHIPENRGEKHTRKIIEAFENNGSNENYEAPSKDLKPGLGARLKLIGLGFVATGAFVAISGGETQGETEVYCNKWYYAGPLAEGQGYSALIGNVAIGEGLTQNDITDEIAEYNGTANPAAGGMFEVPVSCEIVD